MKSTNTEYSDIASTRVFFYCCSLGPPEATAYHHSLICLAEGFKSIGIPFFSNRNYWQTSLEKDSYLFKHDPEVTPDDCSIVIVDSSWFWYEQRFDGIDHTTTIFLDTLFHPNRKYITVYFDMDDGIKTTSWRPEFRRFDFIFRAHYNSRSKYPDNVWPWTFNISNRMLNEIGEIPLFLNRRRSILFNFRCDHSVRKIARDEFYSKIKDILLVDETVNSLSSIPPDSYHALMWAQTGRRHDPIYYQRLKSTVAVAAFGGYYVSPWPKDLGLVDQFLYRAINKSLTYLLPSKRILQWDSWRLWESLAAGCVTFHVDFEKYGLSLPAMPENWKHYIGVDLDNVQETIDRLIAEPEILEHISTAGRQWALDNYSSVPVAVRFLETVTSKSLSPQ